MGVKAEKVETLVIGAGQAGLAMSFELSQAGREHLVLERKRIAERWRSERWDSLAFQFPNWMMRLPGCLYDGNEPDGFTNRAGVVRFIEEYARRIAAPVRQATVIALRQADHGRLAVETVTGGFEAAQVVVATGPYQEPTTPACAAGLAKDVHGLTANRYANPERLPFGAVLVVGSGASGYQIAEDLLKGGRRVYLSVGRHRRVPRRYRGRDFGWWQETTGLGDRLAETLPADFLPPLLTGVDGGKDADLRWLEREGVTLLGGLRGIEGERIHFAEDLDAKLTAGDAGIAEFTRTVDAFVDARGIDAPREAESMPISRPPSRPVEDLDVRKAGIAAVIWATGYRNDFGWIDCPVFDDQGRLRQKRGVTAVPGLYFLGLPRLHKVKSSFLWGCGEDAQFIARHIAALG